jgi:hypothetical protein
MKWNSLTYRHKNFLLWAILLLVMVFIYKKNVRATLSLISDCSELESRIERATNADVRLSMLRTEMKRLNAHSGNTSISSEQVEQEILNQAAAVSQKENLVISSFKEAHTATTNGYIITSHMIEVEGGFVPAVKFIYAFEREFKDARLVSVRFYTREDYKTKKKYLYGTLCFQHVRKA